MIFPEKKAVLRDGRTCMLRSAVPADAEEMRAYLTATSACEMRLYTELRERAQKQSARPTHEKLERAREAYRECLRVLTEGGMVGSGVVSGEHAGGTARPVPLVATSATGLTYTVELDRLDCPVAISTAESNTARIVCTPHLGEA
ncbi:MAG: hypothetical protein KHY54_07890, partial [Roseburia sp.]|nr:hypothetical protein [Roseburia sp.]